MSTEPFCTVVGYLLDTTNPYCTACAQQRRIEDGIHDKRWFPMFNASEYPIQPTCTSDDCETTINVSVQS